MYSVTLISALESLFVLLLRRGQRLDEDEFSQLLVVGANEFLRVPAASRAQSFSVELTVQCLLIYLLLQSCALSSFAIAVNLRYELQRVPLRSEAECV
jgi:hypothetical protein